MGRSARIVGADKSLLWRSGGEIGNSARQSLVSEMPFPAALTDSTQRPFRLRVQRGPSESACLSYQSRSAAAASRKSRRASRQGARGGPAKVRLFRTAPGPNSGIELSRPCSKLYTRLQPRQITAGGLYGQLSCYHRNPRMYANGRLGRERPSTLGTD